MASPRKAATLHPFWVSRNHFSTSWKCVVSPPAPRGRGAVVLGAGVSASHAWGFVLSTGRGDIQPQLDSALQDVNDKYLLLEETEKQAVRKALIEERGRFCTFISMLRPVIVSWWKVPEGLNASWEELLLLQPLWSHWESAVCQGTLARRWVVSGPPEHRTSQGSSCLGPRPPHVALMGKCFCHSPVFLHLHRSLRL